MLGVLITAYILTIVVLAAHGSYFFVRKSAIIPVFCLGALLSSRLTGFLRDWSVFLGLVFLFDAIRGGIYAAITHFDLPVYMGYAITAERALLGGALLPQVLQERWHRPGSESWLDGALVIVHASHFVFFLTLGLAIWLLRREEFRRYCAAMLLVMYAGLLVYLLVPTVPPWMAAAQFEVIPPVHRIAMNLYNASVPTLTAALATNPVAAMPSLHAAFPAIGALVATRIFGLRACWTVPYALLAALSVVYLGEHYLVDILAGWALAALVYVIVYRRSKRSEAGERQVISPAVQDGAVPRRQALAAVAAGALLACTAEGIGILKARILTTFVPTRAFIERELAGKSPVARTVLRARMERDALRGR